MPREKSKKDRAERKSAKGGSKGSKASKGSHGKTKSKKQKEPPRTMPLVAAQEYVNDLYEQITGVAIAGSVWKQEKENIRDIDLVVDRDQVEKVRDAIEANPPPIPVELYVPKVEEGTTRDWLRDVKRATRYENIHSRLNAGMRYNRIRIEPTENGKPAGDKHALLKAVSQELQRQGFETERKGGKLAVKPADVSAVQAAVRKMSGQTLDAVEEEEE
jgi:hypothetical protein